MQSSVARSSQTRTPLRPVPVKDLPRLNATRLLDRVRECVRMMHYSRRAEQAYEHCCCAFIRFHGFTIRPQRAGWNRSILDAPRCGSRLGGVWSSTGLVGSAVPVGPDTGSATALDARHWAARS